MSRQINGGHAFAPRDDPTNWTVSPLPAYNFTVTWVNGTVGSVARRERPQLLLHPTTLVPLVLYNGVQPDSHTDRVFTMAAEIMP